MGLRLKRENYRWNTDMKMVNKSAGFIGHLMKNEITKMEWCVKRLKNKYEDDAPEEIDIIYRSILHLKEFIEKTKQYSSEITLDKKIYCVEDIVKESINLMQGYIRDNIEINIKCSLNIMLLCDKAHMVEVLNNLISNAVEAMNRPGKIYIDTYFDKRRQYFNISVRDNGTGIEKKVLPFIFDPFFTTKISNKNYGLGLAYCSNVMQVHKGHIHIKSSLECGTTAILHFPIKFISEGGNINHEENKNSVCRG